MTLTVILNAVLAIAVVVMVLPPVLWAIFTQHREHPRPVRAEGPAAQPADPQPSDPSRHGSRQTYKPVVRRA